MYPPSLASSDSNSEDSSTCSCGRRSDPYRSSTRKSYSSLDYVASDPSVEPKIRYSGRGGAGSRPRLFTVKCTCPQEGKGADAQFQNFSVHTKSFLRRRSTEALRDVGPPDSTPDPISLAARRNPAAILPAEILPTPAPSSVPSAPALSPTSKTDSDPPRRPRSPYFCFDDALDAPRTEVDAYIESSRSLTAPRAVSRTLRSIASRTQGLFLRDPATPTGCLPPTTSFASPSQILLIPPEVQNRDFGSSSPSSPAPPSAFRAPLPEFLQLPGDNTEDASRNAHVRKWKSGHGQWNRENMGEVVVGLRMLKSK